MEQIKTKDDFTHPEGKIQLLNSIVPENPQVDLGKPTIYAEIITHFSAGGLGACAYSDDISIGELAKCWQHEEYHIKCLQHVAKANYEYLRRNGSYDCIYNDTRV